MNTLAFLASLPLKRPSTQTPLLLPSTFSTSLLFTKHVRLNSRVPKASVSPQPSNIDAYNKWVADQQNSRNELGTSSSLAAESVLKERSDTLRSPPFPYRTLFHAGAEEYAYAMTSAASDDFRFIAEETQAAGLFAPCMVGAVEGQFLKMLAIINGAKRVLDVGTFTGYSALAFAESVGDSGEVVTIEADAQAAAVARRVFERAAAGNRITLLECDARAEVEKMVQRNEHFDIVFLDADKTNYCNYYEAALKMLNDGGIIMADNALGSLVYDEKDPVRDSLHHFAQFVRSDTRVEQVMLTVREGILLVRKV